MAPASGAHSVMQGNLAAAIHAHLKATNSPCFVGTEAPIIPPFRPKKNVRAPDLAVTCTPLSDSKVFENPVLIVEIISPSNEDETWETIHALANLTSLREILVVQSTFVETSVFTRDATGAWSNDAAITQAGGTIHLPSIGLCIPISEVYERTLMAAAVATRTLP